MSVDVDAEVLVAVSVPVEEAAVDVVVEGPVAVEADDVDAPGAVDVALASTVDVSWSLEPPPPPQPVRTALTARAIVGRGNRAKTLKDIGGTRIGSSRNAASPTEVPVDKRCDASLFGTASLVSECNMSRKSRPVPENAEHARSPLSRSVTSRKSVL